MADPKITFLKELASYLDTEKSINNVFVLSGDPTIGEQIVLTPYGGDGRDFVMANTERNFRFIATIFSATLEDCYDLADNFHKNCLLSPEHGYGFSDALHHIEALDDPGEPYENESGGFQCTCNFYVKLKL